MMTNKGNLKRRELLRLQEAEHCTVTTVTRTGTSSRATGVHRHRQTGGSTMKSTFLSTYRQYT